jgi:hypothetical protein
MQYLLVLFAFISAFDAHLLFQGLTTPYQVTDMSISTVFTQPEQCNFEVIQILSVFTTRALA